MAFDCQNGFLQTLNLTRGYAATVALSTANRNTGIRMMIKIKNTDTGGYDCTVNGHSDWINIPSGSGFSSGSSLTNGKTCILKLTLWGTNEDDVVCEWGLEP